MSVAIRRTWLAVQLLVTCGFAASAHAQSSASGSLSVTARVVSPMSMTVTHALDFGKLLTSTTKTIAPNAATSGRFEIIGQGGSSISVTLTMPASLTPTSGSNLPVTGWTYIASDTPALTGTAVSFAANGSVPIPLTLEALAGTAKMYFGLGATISPNAMAAATTYTATGQITAAYTDL